MWFDVNPLRGSGEAWLASIGRALFVAQLFEDLVKRTLFWTDVATRRPSLHEPEARALLLEASRATDESFESRLARAIDLLQARHNVSDEDAAQLRKAKDARNYFAHNAALPCVDMIRGGLSAASATVRFRSELAILIRAYNLLSAWAYQSQEREPAPVGFARQYPRKLEAWVLEPMARRHAGD